MNMRSGKVFQILSLGLVISGVLFTSRPTSVAALACVDLYSDLSYGNTDASSSGPILSLQKYLVQAGYLKATPNGYFGSATRSAVKLFQSANGISNTGRVGPLTRSLLRKQTCPGAQNAASIVSLASVVNSAPVANQVAATQGPAITVNSPVAGSSLVIGNPYTITWNVPTDDVYSIILEESPGGSGAGLIASSISGSRSYSWKIGSVYLASQSDQSDVATGTYRIRIIHNGSGMSDSDPVSGWFTLLPKPLVIDTITPPTITPTDSSTAVIYGTGFAKIIWFISMDQTVSLPILCMCHLMASLSSFLSQPISQPVVTMYLVSDSGLQSNSHKYSEVKLETAYSTISPL